MSVLGDIEVINSRVMTPNGAWAPATGNQHSVQHLLNTADHKPLGISLTPNTLTISCAVAGEMRLWVTKGSLDEVNLIEVRDAILENHSEIFESSIRVDQAWERPEGYWYGKSASKASGLWVATLREPHRTWLVEVGADKFKDLLNDTLMGPKFTPADRFNGENHDHSCLYMLCPATGYPISLLEVFTYINSKRPSLDWVMEVKDRITEFKKLSL